jgi:hypothetical protein
MPEGLKEVVIVAICVPGAVCFFVTLAVLGYKLLWQRTENGQVFNAQRDRPRAVGAARTPTEGDAGVTER